MSFQINDKSNSLNTLTSRSSFLLHVIKYRNSHSQYCYHASSNVTIINHLNKRTKCLLFTNKIWLCITRTQHCMKWYVLLNITMQNKFHFHFPYLVMVNSDTNRIVHRKTWFPLYANIRCTFRLKAMFRLLKERYIVDISATWILETFTNWY